MGNVCTHYRTFNLRVYFSFSKAIGCETCNQCSSDDAKVIVQTNYRDTSSPESHDICCFFENNKIKFKLEYSNCACKIMFHQIEVTS